MRKKYKKYHFQKAAIILGIVLCGVFFSLLIAMIIILLVMQLPPDVKSILELIKELSLIGFTVFGSSLISALFIEKSNKNNEYISLIANDVISDEMFLNTLTENNERKIKEKVLGETQTRAEMVISFMDQIQNEKYYFDKCSIGINCRVEGDKIYKKIVRTMQISSFEKKQIIDDFKLIGVAGEENYANNNDLLKIKYVKVDGKTLKESEYKKICEKVEPEQYGYQRNNYSYKCKCVLKKSLHIEHSKPTLIELEYETIVSKLDTKYVSRITAPCKSFSLQYNISGSKDTKYSVVGTAFGFMDDGNKHPNIQENTYTIEFDHWTYNKEGVIILIKENKD